MGRGAEVPFAAVEDGAVGCDDLPLAGCAGHAVSARVPNGRRQAYQNWRKLIANSSLSLFGPAATISTDFLFVVFCVFGELLVLASTGRLVFTISFLLEGFDELR